MFDKIIFSGSMRLLRHRHSVGELDLVSVEKHQKQWFVTESNKGDRNTLDDKTVSGVFSTKINPSSHLCNVSK